MLLSKVHVDPALTEKISVSVWQAILRQGEQINYDQPWWQGWSCQTQACESVDELFIVFQQLPLMVSDWV